MELARKLWRRTGQLYRSARQGLKELPYELGLRKRKLACFPDMEPVNRRTFHHLQEIARFSMLHPKTLMGLRHLVRASEGTILEIGPYVGGSTVVIAEALRNSRRKRPFLTVEVGGSRLDYPSVPSADILRDLRSNLQKYQVADLVQILEGWSYDPPVVEGIIDAGKKEPFGLLFIDGNGEFIEKEVARLLPYCREDCFMVFDDYYCDAKGPFVRAFVEKYVAQGTFEPISLLPHETWFGRRAA